MKGFGISQNSKKGKNKPRKLSKEQIVNHAFNFHRQGNITESAKYYQYFINQGFKDHIVFSNYGSILRNLGKPKEAENLYRQAIELNPNFADAHSNLGNILRDLGNLNEAKKSYQKAIELNPSFTNAHYNLGNIFRDLGNLNEAEKSYLKAIELNPNFADAHSNLGNIFRDLDNLNEAEKSYLKAVELKGDDAESFTNLGMVLTEIGKLKEAEILLRKAIKLEPKNSIYHLNLCICLYLLNDKDMALNIIKTAHAIDSNNKAILLLLKILSGLKAGGKTDSEIEKIRSDFFNGELDSNIFICNRDVETDLINTLYKIKAIDAQKTNKYQPVIIGNTRGSNFSLFDNNLSTINSFKEDISYKLETYLKSNIFIKDSFVTIFKSGGGVKRHAHIAKIDKLLRLKSRKYSLVYYVSVGDQTSAQPGILKFYNPNKEILPKEGMIIIFPSDMDHSAFYSGNKDRIIIGINFYIV